MSVTYFLLVLFTAPVGIITLYLGAITVLSFFPKTGRSPLSDTFSPVLVIIPAHNEAENIETTITSIQACSYPANIWVIADNCSDSTAIVAAQAGATVVERTDELNRGKGQALDWFFHAQASTVESFELVTIIDADTTVSKNYLQVMAGTFSDHSVQAAQAFYDVANPKDGWRNMLMSIALRAFHHTRPTGRNTIGGTAGLKGNGMMFRSSLLLSYGWPAHSVVEDLEFSLMLACDGIAVTHVNGATVLGDMPFSAQAASTQRSRWEGGRFQMMMKWVPLLMRKIVAEPSMLRVDALADLLTPPFTLLVAAQALLFLAWSFYSGLSVGMIMLMCISTAYIVSGLIQTKAPFVLWRALFLAPLFVGWKLCMYARMLLRKVFAKSADQSASEWVRSTREGKHGE